ncbi:hypothetical protein [Cytobacillus oceanisediminis]|uniref:hypothetical protein n=1 Tax=Cytobacillus oceanisediminis TaxID=665099 RepID=UPI00119FF2EB|nr:hypothetical protein [Cytobacillus oceanisediminis]
MKKLALELFHNSSPAESEVPGIEINGPILQADLNKEGVPKFYTFWDTLFIVCCFSIGSTEKAL